MGTGCCLGGNGTTAFLNMHFDVSGPKLFAGDLTGLNDMTADMTAYASCTLPALAPVTVVAP